MITKLKNNFLFTGAEWSHATLEKTYKAIEEIALEDLGLDVYRNQIEIISSEQMLDAYSSVGLPLMYQHWSFGKRFAHDELLYRKGYQGLAYEIVINSNPCISYNMEENTMPMQTLVMAHAAFGHNHFFKNNYLYRQWTDADGILEYLQFAKSYISKCEEKHGPLAVEEMLDAAHALMDYGVFRYRRPPPLSTREEESRRREREEYEARTFNDLWRTLPKSRADKPDEADEEIQRRRKLLKLPQENILYFLEKFSPVLETWQREILHIVRTISQYFYPQKQTKVMNEGCATFVHYYIVNKLYDLGLIGEGALLEILHSHSSVVLQPNYDDPRFSGINPYALGFEMMCDIKRMCTEPTDEDRLWFPELAGSGDWRGALKYAWANFRDESFILQYLSPHVMRKFRMFLITDIEVEAQYSVKGIHDEAGYRKVRAALARSYDIGVLEPDVQVVDADLKGDRCLHLLHLAQDHVPLDARQRDETMRHLRRLWGYNVQLKSIDRDTGALMSEVFMCEEGVVARGGDKG